MQRETRVLATGVGVLTALLLLFVSSMCFSQVEAGAPGQTEIPLQCRPGWYNPPYEHCPPRPTGSPTPRPSATPRPTPTAVGVGIVPQDLPDTSTQ